MNIEMFYMIIAALIAFLVWQVFSINQKLNTLFKISAVFSNNDYVTHERLKVIEKQLDIEPIYEELANYDVEHKISA